MSSGVVNPLATGINSTCKVGGGGGGIRFDVAPPQPANATVTIPDKIALHRRLLNGKSHMVPPGWHFHSPRPPPGTSSHSQPFRVNTLQNLANLRPFLQRKRDSPFYGKIEVCRQEFMAHRSTLEAERPTKNAKPAKKSTAGKPASSEDRERIFDLFRRRGCLEA